LCSGLTRIWPPIFTLSISTGRPLNDVRVRTALSMAIDRESIVKNILKGGQLPAWCFTRPIPAAIPVRRNYGSIPRKPAGCLQRLVFSATKSFPRSAWLYNTSETHHTIAQAIQEMWKKYLNVKVNLKNQEWKVYLAATHSQDYDIARMGWSGDYNDPNSFLDMWITAGATIARLVESGLRHAHFTSLRNASTKRNGSPCFKKPRISCLSN